MKALVALALAGCAPTLIWSGHSADRRHTFEVVGEADHQRVVVDGVRGPAYSRIAAWSMQTAGSRVVYAARVGGAWVVVDPGRPSERWDGIGEIAVAGDRTAYVAERGGRWHVVVDGRAGPAWDAVLADTLRFASNRVVYVARDARGAHVVVDGTIGAAWDGVASLVFDGSHVGYVARAADGAAVVADGVAGPRYREIAKLALAGAQPVYAARDADGWHVVAAAPSPAYREVRSIVSAGGHTAWIARDDAGELVACDGATVAHVDAIKLALVDGCDVVYATRDGHVVRGELDQRYDEIGNIVVAQGHVAFGARLGASWYMVVDGRPRAVGSYAGDPVFTADGARLAYVARRDRRWLAIVDDHPFAFDLLIDGTLAFSRDGRRWAVIAGDLSRERLFFAIDGTRRVPLAPAEIYSIAERTQLGDDGAVLRAWAAAEADKPSER